MLIMLNILCVVFDLFLFCDSEAGHGTEDPVSLVVLEAIYFQIRFPQLLDCLNLKCLHAQNKGEYFVRNI